MHKISICIPVFNAEKYILDCIESICSQKGELLEIIICNDCSSDNSIDIIKQFIDKEKLNTINFVFLTNEQNMGPALSRKKAIEASSGDYFWCVDSDDRIITGACSRIYQQINLTEADIICFDYLEERGDYKKKIAVDFDSDPSIQLSKVLKSTHNGCLWNKVIKKDFYVKSTVQNFNFAIGEDFIVIVQLLKKKPILSYIGESLYTYRIVENSLSHTQSIHYYKDYIRMVTAVLSLLNANEKKSFSDFLCFLKLSIAVSGYFSKKEVCGLFPILSLKTIFCCSVPFFYKLSLASFYVGMPYLGYTFIKIQLIHNKLLHYCKCGTLFTV